MTVLLDLEPRPTGTGETEVEIGFDEADCRPLPSRCRHDFAADHDFAAEWLPLRFLG